MYMCVMYDTLQLICIIGLMFRKDKVRARASNNISIYNSRHNLGQNTVHNLIDNNVEWVCEQNDMKIC